MRRSRKAAWLLTVLWTVAAACTESPTTTSGAPTTTAPAPAPSAPALTAAPPTTATRATPAPAPPMPGYEVAGAPAGWDREVDMLDGTHYRLQYLQPLENLDPVAQVEAVGRRISLIVATDSDGRTQTLGSSYPGHPASVAGVAATVFETAPPPGGRHGVFWRANGFVFELYAYMDEAPLLRLAATVRPTGRPIAR